MNLDLNLRRNKCPKKAYFGSLNTISVVHLWVIPKFCSIANDASVGFVLKSPEFSTKDYYNCEVSGYLKLYPKGITYEDKDYLSLSLCLNRMSLDNIKIKYYFCIINKNKEELNTVHGEYFCKLLSNYSIHIQFVKRDWVLDKNRNLLDNDNLNILCKISFGDEVEFQNYEYTFELSKDLEFLFNNQDFSDVKLVTKGNNFCAHKNILASRSSVFSAMFKYNMRENNENVVNISDVNDDILREMLYFIYTGRLNNVNINMAQNLLIAADKYDISGLRKAIGKIIKNSLNDSNATNLLILADSCNAAELKNSIIDYITKHTNVIETRAFKAAKNLHAHLLIDTLCKIIKK